MHQRASPLLEEPSQNEMLPSERAGPARPPWETGTLNIADCERTEFVVALKKGETAGTRIDPRRYKRSSNST